MMRFSILIKILRLIKFYFWRLFFFAVFKKKAKKYEQNKKNRIYMFQWKWRI